MSRTYNVNVVATENIKDGKEWKKLVNVIRVDSK